MNRAEAEQMIRTCYEARRREDVSEVAKYFAEDATFRIVANPDLGDFGNQLTGKDQIIEVWQSQFKTWDWTDFPIQSILIDDHAAPTKAAVMSRGTIVHTASARPFEVEVADLLTIADGKIVDFLEFCDTHKVSQILTAAG